MGFFACDLGSKAACRPTVDWEEPRCLLCNSQRCSILVEAPDPLEGSGGLWFAITQCQDCGLCYTNPRPSADCISQFYTKHYPPHGKALQRRKRSWQRWTPWRAGRHKNLEGLLGRGQGRLLDFGCGSGAFLNRMHQRGWQVTGIDASEQAVQRIRTHLGLRVLAGTLPHPELGDETFDVITMRQSLEHVHQPLDVLRAAYRLLVPHGQLIVSTPNIDSLPFKWFGSSWRGLDLPRHLTHFTPDTLQLMLARAGFEVGPARMLRHPEWMRRSARLACRRSEPPRWQKWLCGRMLASIATWCAFLARRCDGIMVTAVKGLPIPLDDLPSFNHREQARPRFPADRWRNR
jgi:2-polyprenyl-3-methyl-5-hydroxy-6-metoxy-1,4-benzoquinol methylase